mmetsp:Transcript_104240/g.185218  ORF Transcript_104240/g.185218 Transcript_104240/m.185218 type:complete len:571 (+) Transcript_104240:87-1799(+)|eukprot:CAMPEP_0197625504 /NCGR_PEP_ID=MMETSP1338-20131121/4855_1 /TAXON_ID=43686 ORGANISM="Pelagodinium beii, Strain RCC1491" /NCGR_SAMPLE_ID=MMETSP1338 /ASSEMBLY_ACC=CAM_ASM_000754 /LENGTH=570 /DNA_ID=CAMNT_0043195933 /DNA_START=66 /DNA_END=1778 /DNA_ORIENTATION=+
MYCCEAQVEPELTVEVADGPYLVSVDGAGAQYDLTGSVQTADLSWINHALAGMWPEFQDVAEFMLNNKILPMVKEKLMAKTDKVKDIGFQEFSLGKMPPRLETIKVTNLPGGIARVQVRFEYVSDMKSVTKLETTLGTFTSGIQDLSVKGEGVMLMNPYEESSPGTASCSGFLVDVPEVDFKFAGEGASFVNSIGLKGIIVHIAGIVMQKLMVLPNMITVNVGMLEMKVYPPVMEQPDPIGMMRVTFKKGGLVKQKKDFSLKRSFENVFEAIDTAMGKAMGKDMTEYFQLVLGEQEWEPRSNETGKCHDFYVVDPMQKLHLSIWDVDVAGSNDEMAKIGPFHMDQLQAMSGKPITLFDEDKHPYATSEFQFEWFDIQPGVVGKDDSMVMAGIRELKLKGAMDKDMGKLSVKGKLGSIEETTHAATALKDKLQTESVKDTLEEVRERMQKAKMEESVIKQIMDLKPKITRLSINASIELSLKSTEIPSAVLELSIIETKKDKMETVIAQKSVKISELKAAQGMNLPSPMVLMGSGGEIEAEIDLQLCGMVLGNAPGEGKVVALYRHAGHGA